MKEGKDMPIDEMWAENCSIGDVGGLVFLRDKGKEARLLLYDHFGAHMIWRWLEDSSYCPVIARFALFRKWVWR